MLLTCPECDRTNKQDAIKCMGCGFQFRKSHNQSSIYYNCPWSDHGNICGKKGTCASSGNGEGPWYCSRHYWLLTYGIDLGNDLAVAVNKSGAYKLEHCGALKCVAVEAGELYKRLTAGQLGPVKVEL